MQLDGPVAASQLRAHELDRRILRFIECVDADDAAFERIALEVFTYQYETNGPYRRFCDRLGRTPDVVRGWIDVPAIPTSVFAQLRLACFPPERTRQTFVSSGTTRDARSRLELEDTALYDASLLAHFRQRVLPDTHAMQLVALAPSFDDAPSSSLSYMLSKIAQVYGTPDDGFYLRGDELDFEAVAAALRGAAQPLLVVGTAFGFVHFFDRCAGAGLRFALPRGSRVVETGGFKGQSREVGRDELYGWFERVLGVPRELCVSEYGMCELGSQWYDANLEDAMQGRTPRLHLKVGPHWARALIVDRVTGAPRFDDEPGLLQVLDLSNRGSVASVLTGDLARRMDGGFELLGRAPGEPPKGCSIAVDAALERAAPVERRS